MARQMERLQNVLEGFLKADWEKISSELYQMRQDIEQISSEYGKYTGENIPTLKALDEVRKETTALQEALDAKNYEEAYQHFQLVTYQCIQCHQAQRIWGKFEEITDGTEVKEEGKEEKKEKAVQPAKEKSAKGPAPAPASTEVSKVFYQ
jgi:mono/diheme cytochrome c family protein